MRTPNVFYRVPPMPIKIPNDLPARAILERERIAVIDESQALRQDIRPLEIAVLNLMPDKIVTETQLLRVLGHTPLQIQLTLLRPASHQARNTSQDHLLAFYQTWEDVKDRRFDALIVTGAPVEQMPFEEVTYWPELAGIFDWASRNVFSSLFICWGAQAALYHYHGVPKHLLKTKQFGVFQHCICKAFEPLTAGFDDCFTVPVSRHTEVRHKDIAQVKGLEILAESSESGLCLVHEPSARRVFMFNHLEYDAETLQREYQRDASSSLGTAVPCNYFPGNDPKAMPRMTWRAHRNLLFGNWINLVYQGTPYDLSKLEEYI